MAEKTGIGISPYLFVGVFIFVIPTLLNIFHIFAPLWLSKIGLFVLMGGIIHTAILRYKQK